MELLLEETRKIYNLDAVKAGWVVYAKHRSWMEGLCGYITFLSPTEIAVQYKPDIRNVSNHFFIPVEQVTNGEWVVRFSADLKEVYELEMGDKGEAG